MPFIFHIIKLVSGRVCEEYHFSMSNQVKVYTDTNQHQGEEQQECELIRHNTSTYKSLCISQTHSHSYTHAHPHGRFQMCENYVGMYKVVHKICLDIYIP